MFSLEAVRFKFLGENLLGAVENELSTLDSLHLANEHKFWNRSTFLEKHQILSRRLKESLSGISVEIPGCRAGQIMDTDQRTSKLNVRDSLQISLMNITGKYRSHTFDNLGRA